MQATCLCYKMASIEKMQFSSQWHFKSKRFEHAAPFVSFVCLLEIIY